MNKFIGYLIMAIGVLATASPFLIKDSLPALIKPYLMIAGLVLLILGFLFVNSSSSKSRVTQSEEEVPIYQGEGKKRKIVGYRKEK